MDFFDCNLSYGPDTMKGELPGCSDVGALRRRLDVAGIAGGFVYYAMDEPVQGNATLAGDIAGQSALYGVWSLLPSYTGEIPPPDKLPPLMGQYGVAALTINPRANRYLPRASVIGDYLEMATERRIPVMLNTGRGLSIEDADSIMREFRDLTAILTFANCWPSDRLLYPFLEAYPNLFVDMTYIQTAAWLPDAVYRYTARRILFGSGFPECYMGAHMMVIKHAMIEEDDKEYIAGINLRNIMGGARYD